MEFKSGFVSMIGRPNTGKSTLLNALTGTKVSIVSDKPQTTRNIIKTVITTKEYQIIFMDTPGIYKPKNKLGNYMVGTAENTLKEVDAVLFLVDATCSQPHKGDLEIIEKLKSVQIPVFLILNKVDLIEKMNVLPLIDSYNKLMNFDSIIPISALNQDGIDIILKEIITKIPQGPKFFPDDTLTCDPERFIVSEIIREKMLQLLEDEIPHGIGIEVVSFKDRENKDIIDINVNIYCEKKSHKAIIIGKNGKMLKEIGSLARTDIEALLSSKIFLELWVKIRNDWRNSDNMLNMLGYK